MGGVGAGAAGAFWGRYFLFSEEILVTAKLAITGDLSGWRIKVSLNITGF
jgi:hypothetical protein